MVKKGFRGVACVVPCAAVIAVGCVPGATLLPNSCAPATMVDDMEDGQSAICANQGRTGDWFDVMGPVPGATLSPTPGTSFDAWPLAADARPGSSFGMRLAGTGFGGPPSSNAWAYLGLPLNAAAGGPYDASQFTGVSFYGKNKTGPMRLRVSFGTTESRDNGIGGSCVEPADPKLPGCEDAWGVTVDLTSAWRQYHVEFQSLAQEGWGKTVAKNLAHLWTIEFHYSNDPNPGDFEFLIDDVQFE